MEAGAVPIGSHPLTWQDYERIVYGRAAVRLETAERVARHRAELERQLAAGAVIYAVNTGYGADSGRVIPCWRPSAGCSSTRCARTRSGWDGRFPSLSAAACS